MHAAAKAHRALSQLQCLSGEKSRQACFRSAFREGYLFSAEVSLAVEVCEQDGFAESLHGLSRQAYWPAKGAGLLQN